jgi:ABC-type phosphate transport system permease subunit
MGFIERRGRKPDRVSQCIALFVVIGWVFAIFMLGFQFEAQPKGEDFFTRYFGSRPNLGTDLGLLRLSFISLVVSFTACVVGILLSFKRNRRKTDKFNKPLIVLGIITIVGIFVFFVKF